MCVNINSLNYDLLESIFRNELSIVERPQIASVCKAWNKILESALLWEMKDPLKIETKNIKKIFK